MVWPISELVNIKRTINPARRENNGRRSSSAMDNFGLELGSNSLDTRDIGSLWRWESKTQVAGYRRLDATRFEE
jgi:hypothetical protein